MSSPGENAKEEQETSSLRFSQRGRFGGDDDACIIIILARLLLVVVHLLGPVDSEEDEVAFVVVDDDAPKKAALLLLGGPDNILLSLSYSNFVLIFPPKRDDRETNPVSKEKRVLYKGKGKREEKGKELARGKKTLSLLFSFLFSLRSSSLSLSSERREFMERARVRVGSAADALREDTRHFLTFFV